MNHANFLYWSEEESLKIVRKAQPKLPIFTPYVYSPRLHAYSCVVYKLYVVRRVSPEQNDRIIFQTAALIF